MSEAGFERDLIVCVAGCSMSRRGAGTWQGCPSGETAELLELDSDHSTSTTEADSLLVDLASTVPLVSESHRAHGRTYCPLQFGNKAIGCRLEHLKALEALCYKPEGREVETR
jgi:hypothetical protein